MKTHYKASTDTYLNLLKLQRVDGLFYSTLSGNPKLCGRPAQLVPFVPGGGPPSPPFRPIIDRDFTDAEDSLLTKPPTWEASRQERSEEEAKLSTKLCFSPCSRNTRLVATLIQKVTDGSRLSPLSATVTTCHSDYFIHKPFFSFKIAIRSKKVKEKLPF